jgi:hypothetical protein
MAVKRYDGSQWVTVAGKGDQGTSSSISTWVKTASGGETSLSGNDDNSQALSYTVGQELVFINGTLLKRGSDYTATNGTSITGLTALTANDIATVWTVNAFSVTGAIANTIVDAKGDILVGTAADTPGRLAVGSNDQVLTADSSTGTGLKWATPSSGALTLINAGGTTLSGSSVSVTSIPGTYKNLHIYIEGFYAGSNNNNGYIQFNTTTSDNYAFIGLRRSGGNAEANATEGNNDVGIYFASVMGTSDTGNFAYFMVPNYSATTHRKVAFGISYTKNDGSPGDYYVMEPNGVLQNSSSAITSVQVVSNGSWSGGKVYVYGEN